MPIVFNRELLEKLGLGSIGAADGDQLLETMHETLELRVGTVLAERLSSSELDHFESAMAVGEAEALAALEAMVPDYAAVVAQEAATLETEVATEADTILAACSGSMPTAEPFRYQRGDPGPVLLEAPAGWALVVSTMGSTVVAVDPGRTEVYAAHTGSPPVVLRVPDAHHVDPTSIWCSERGEVRCRFAEHSDLRWRLADRPMAAVVDYDKVRRRRRAALPWTDVEAQDGPLQSFSSGPWQVQDAHEMEVTDQTTGGRARLEPLHDGPHTNAVRPHFTPDRTQLVAAFNSTDGGSGLKACSDDHLRSIVKSASDAGGELWPWEHELQPTAEPGDPGREPPPIERLGYDASSTRVAVADRQRVHLVQLPEWTAIAHADRPEGGARVEAVPVPGGGSPSIAWAGRSVVIAGADRRVWRLDLRGGEGTPALVTDDALAEVGSAGPLVAVSGWGDVAQLVYRDRLVVTIDERGGVTTRRLAGDDPLRAAAETADGRLLVSAGRSIELFAGARSVARVPLIGEPVTGLVACATDPEWALAWHEDSSVSAVRISGRSVRVSPDYLPHRPDGAVALLADHAEMSRIDRWHLAVPSGSGTGSRLLGPKGWLDLDTTALASMPSADLSVFGTADGLHFMPTVRPSGTYLRPVPLPGPVRSIATGRCARSLAVAGDGVVWLVRLLC